MAGALSEKSFLAGVSLDFTEDEAVLSVRVGYGLPEALIRVPEKLINLTALIKATDVKLKEHGGETLIEALGEIGVSLFGGGKKEKK